MGWAEYETRDGKVDDHWPAITALKPADLQLNIMLGKAGSMQPFPAIEYIVALLRTQRSAGTYDKHVCSSQQDCFVHPNLFQRFSVSEEYPLREAQDLQRRA